MANHNEKLNEQLKEKGICMATRGWLICLYYGVPSLMDGNNWYPKKNYNKIRRYCNLKSNKILIDQIEKSECFEVTDSGFRSLWWCPEADEGLTVGKKTGGRNSKNRENRPMDNATKRSPRTTPKQWSGTPKQSHSTTDVSSATTLKDNNKYNIYHDNINIHDDNIYDKKNNNIDSDNYITPYNNGVDAGKNIREAVEDAPRGEGGPMQQVDRFFSQLDPSDESCRPVFEKAREVICRKHGHLASDVLDKAVDLLIFDELKDYFRGKADQFNGKNRKEKIRWIANFANKCAEKMADKAVAEAEQLKDDEVRREKFKSYIDEQEKNKKDWRDNRPNGNYEWYDEDQKKRYYDNPNGEAVELPKEAPPRPSGEHEWNSFSQAWTVYVPDDEYDELFLK